MTAFLQRLSALRAMQPLHANTARQLEVRAYTCVLLRSTRRRGCTILQEAQEELSPTQRRSDRSNAQETRPWKLPHKVARFVFERWDGSLQTSAEAEASLNAFSERCDTEIEVKATEGAGSRKVCVSLLVQQTLERLRRAAGHGRGWGRQAAYGLNQSKNAEIRFSWYQLAIAAELSEVVPEVIDFVTSQVRRCPPPCVSRRWL